MEERFNIETENLKSSWSKYDRSVLRDYLVKDVQEPRINIQSILTRHWLIRQLFGNKYEELMEHEIRFSFVMNWLLGLIKKQIRIDQLQAILESLISKQEKAGSIIIPSYITETFSKLALPNYICDALNLTEIEDAGEVIPEYLISTFERIWKEVLEQEQADKITLLEHACGSANDYRFIDSFGISKFVNYFGYDLCEKNILNAKHMFPEANFEIGNVLDIQDKDKSHDYCIIHDLFEHLSIDAMEYAIKEICRVTKLGICANFFNMHEEDEHKVNSVKKYHWNKLSRNKIEKLFLMYFSQINIIHIDGFLSEKYRYNDTKNKDAYTFFIRI